MTDGQPTIVGSCGRRLRRRSARAEGGRGFEIAGKFLCSEDSGGPARHPMRIGQASRSARGLAAGGAGRQVPHCRWQGERHPFGGHRRPDRRGAGADPVRGTHSAPGRRLCVSDLARYGLAHTQPREPVEDDRSDQNKRDAQ
jgi:hypothetical protein